MAKTRSGYKKVKSLFGKYKQVLEDWDLKKLEKVGKVIGGGTPDSTNMAYWNGEILWAIPTDITKLQTNQIENTERKITKEGLDNSSAKLLPKGTILITSRATIGECAIATKPISTNQGFQSIICNNDNFDRMYIFYSIKYHKSELLRLAYGTTFLEINKSEIKKVMLSIPSSILEQQKIASILSGVDALIESTQNIIEKTERLKKGLMQQLLIKGIKHTKFKKVQWWFNKEIEIPEEWNIKKLWELSEKIKDIVAGPFGSDLTVRDYRNEGVPIIRLQNIGRNKFINKNIKFINNKKAEDLAYHSYIPNDLVLAKLGDPIGKTCKIPENFPEGIVVADVVRIRTSSKKSNQNFLEYVLNSNICEKQHIIETIGTTRPRVNLEQIRNLQFPTPPINEQQKIASILSGVDAYIQKNQQYKERLEKLKKGLMQKLLTGQIRVKV